MRLLIVGINYAPELTGVGKYTAEMAEWLAARGHEVRVVTSVPYYPEWRVYKPYAAWRYSKECLFGVKVWRCPVWVPCRPSGLKRLVHLASYAIACIPVLIAQAFWKPDVVLAIEPPLFSALPAALCARLAGAKTWLHIQDFEIDAALALGVINTKQFHRYIAKAETWLMNRFDLVSSISDNMVSSLLTKGVPGLRTRLFPNWVDLNMIFPIPNSNSLRSALHINEKKVVALYSGNMGEKQGLEIILEAASMLENLVEIQFVLCGDGAAREKLERQYHQLKNVLWVPLQPLEKLNELLNMADMHLLPQRVEAEDLVMPSKLTGMLASGRPVIATARNGTQLEKVVSRCGLVAQPGCVDQLAALIVKLAGDPATRLSLGKKARSYAETYLGRDQVLVQFENELFQLHGST